ncbi:uncharacterized protein LOC122050496 [Zingiber officinale]|uniref:Epoxide hydrolase n=1 Tax=Zingiber officinale TaxID=94328 RepID=A0A8J5HCV4_ZINOF|nr:uncharacterized protein LOC122050496 [Zingiber officinale]KAG6521321.1 hypothetical protein ZIOFF_018436 [Zingiber officinale]
MAWMQKLVQALNIVNGWTPCISSKCVFVKFLACLRGLRGDASVLDCSFVACQVTELSFFASKVRLGRSGVEEEEVLPLGPENEFESSASLFQNLHSAVEHETIEAEFVQIGTATIPKKFLTYRTPAAIMVPKEKGFQGSLETPINMPSWLTEEDINYFASKFEKSGFTRGLNYYRCMNLIWELIAPWVGVQLKVPTKFIVGDLDRAYHSPGIQDCIHKGGFKNVVPLLEDIVVMEGVGHFINQEKPHDISDLIYDFISKF